MRFTSKTRDYLRTGHSMSPYTQRCVHGWRNQRTQKNRSRKADPHINRNWHHPHSPHHPGLTVPPFQQRHHLQPTPLHILTPTVYPHARDSRQDQGILANYSMLSNRRSHYIHSPHHLGLTAPSFQQRHHLRPTPLRILTPTVYPHPKDSRQDQGILANYSMRNSVPC